MSNTRERITFFYESEDDQDIHEWIKSLPERGKTSHIQKAIRFYLEHNAVNNETEVEPKEIKEIFEEMKHMKSRILALEETIKGYTSSNIKTSDDVVTTNENEEKSSKVEEKKENLIDAKDVLKDFGLRT